MCIASSIKAAKTTLTLSKFMNPKYHTLSSKNIQKNPTIRRVSLEPVSSKALFWRRFSSPAASSLLMPSYNAINILAMTIIKPAL